MKAFRGECVRWLGEGLTDGARDFEGECEGEGR